MQRPMDGTEGKTTVSSLEGTGPSMSPFPRCLLTSVPKYVARKCV